MEKTNNELPEGSAIIKLPSFSGKGGILTMIQRGEKLNEVPFEIERVLVTTCGQSSEERGAHTHHESRQIFFVLSGGCTILLDNGKDKSSVTLTNASEGLLMEPYVWHVMKDFKENTVTLALFNTVYDEKDYIRNYEEFLKCLKK
ncbi:MAG: FdtA/QdtA family cupin domain-containing protein [Patescibacteria group bacterium]